MHRTPNKAPKPKIRAAFSKKNLFRLLLLSALAYIVWDDKFSLHPASAGRDDTEEFSEEGKTVRAAFLSDENPGAKKKRKKTDARVELPAGALNNVTFAIDPDYARRNDLPEAENVARVEVVREYIRRFAPVAVAEMRKFGVPASITLAQGLLESNAGESALARKTNNHFGIKCFSRSCAKGHCSNFTDDTHKDFFVKYPNSWGSFRAHSQFLKNSGRYQGLFDLEKKDYRSWARGLSKAGYATDKKYADKLIAIVQNLGLERYDRF